MCWGDPAPAWTSGQRGFINKGAGKLAYRDAGPGFCSPSVPFSLRDGASKMALPASRGHGQGSSHSSSPQNQPGDWPSLGHGSITVAWGVGPVSKRSREGAGR